MEINHRLPISNAGASSPNVECPDTLCHSLLMVPLQGRMLHDVKFPISTKTWPDGIKFLFWQRDACLQLILIFGDVFSHHWPDCWFRGCFARNNPNNLNFSSLLGYSGFALLVEYLVNWLIKLITTLYGFIMRAQILTAEINLKFEAPTSNETVNSALLLRHPQC